jgi:rhodanese-related sulfurtransferase
MIIITNLNFHNQTIQSIEVNGETVDNLEIKLTKTKFNIVIVKDNKSIKKKVKKKDTIVDVIIEEVVTEDIEEVIEDTLAKIKDLLKKHIPKKNTLVSYCRTIQQVFDFLKIQDIHELPEQDIIDYIEKQYESISTLKVNCVLCIKFIKFSTLKAKCLKAKLIIT